MEETAQTYNAIYGDRTWEQITLGEMINKGGAAGRQLSVKIDHSVGDMALAVGHAFVRGRTDRAVAQDKILNLRFFEQCSHN